MIKLLMIKVLKLCIFFSNFLLIFISEKELDLLKDIIDLFENKFVELNEYMNKRAKMDASGKKIVANN